MLLGSEGADEYWSAIGINWIQGEQERVDAAQALVDHGRGIAALDILAMALAEKQSPPADLAMSALNVAFPPSDPDLARAGSALYDVAQVFDYLDRVVEPGSDALAKLEWRYLPLMRYGRRDPKRLHGELSRSPQFFADLVSTVYRRDDADRQDTAATSEEQEPTDSDEEQADDNVVLAGYELMQSWKTPPGQQDGVLDGDVLRGWITEAREALTTADHLRAGDVVIGQVLRHAVPDEGDVWPPLVVRDLIETLQSTALESGLAAEVTNSRGVTSRGHDAGGDQERAFAETFRQAAEARPRVRGRMSAPN